MWEWECGRRYSGWVLRSLEFGANAGASEWLNVGGIRNPVCSKPAPPGYEQTLESGGREGGALFTTVLITHSGYAFRIQPHIRPA